MRTKYGQALNEKYFLKFCYGDRRQALPKESLTEKQARVYNYLKAGLTVREVSNETGLRHSVLQGHITHIQTTGYVL